MIKEKKVLTPRGLAKDIKGYLLLNYRIEEIKEGALNQGVTDEIWDKAIAILIQRSKIKKYVQKLVNFLIYISVGVLLFYSYLWWSFSRSELQIESTFREFIQYELPLSAFGKIQKSKTIEAIDRSMEPNPDLLELYDYTILKGIKDIYDFELYFDVKGQLERSKVHFYQDGEVKMLEIASTGAFIQIETSSKELIEGVKWRNVFQSIPTVAILEKFGTTMRKMTLSVEKTEDEDEVEVRLSIVYEKTKGDYRETYMIFDGNGIRLRGRGDILSLIIKPSEVKVKISK